MLVDILPMHRMQGIPFIANGTATQRPIVHHSTAPERTREIVCLLVCWEEPVLVGASRHTLYLPF